MQIVQTPITVVIPYQNNPRINKNTIEKVANSILEFGFTNPILVDENNVIVAGHTRLLAAKKLNLSTVPIIVLKNLPPQKIRAYRIADNRIGMDSIWDEALLSSELKDLFASDYELTHTGFDESELKNLLNFDLSSESENDDINEKTILEVVVSCESEREQQAAYELLTSQGYTCRILSI